MKKAITVFALFIAIFPVFTCVGGFQRPATAGILPFQAVGRSCLQGRASSIRTYP
ncbi:MAG: hypothetical protein LBH42_01495 [Treponema sp.]|jgi:hypothetical protein|nr:hypothetical protein [Treponema sp.]